jgi:hypothetical protein
VVVVDDAGSPGRSTGEDTTVDDGPPPRDARFADAVEHAAVRATATTTANAAESPRLRRMSTTFRTPPS